MGEILDKILNRPELGVFGLLFIYTFYLLRKDSINHISDYKELTERLMEIVKQNTEANTKLNESIDTLREHVLNFEPTKK